MVVLNLTLFVELALFLVFLWVTNKFIFRPILRMMDAREAEVAEDMGDASAATEEAEALEKQYTTATRADKRAAREAYRQAHRAAQERHAAMLAERRKQADEEVSSVRATALRQMEMERAKCEMLAPDLADVIARRLGLGDDDS